MCRLSAERVGGNVDVDVSRMGRLSAVLLDFGGLDLMGVGYRTDPVSDGRFVRLGRWRHVLTMVRSVLEVV